MEQHLRANRPTATLGHDADRAPAVGRLDLGPLRQLQVLAVGGGLDEGIPRQVIVAQRLKVSHGAPC